MVTIRALGSVTKVRGALIFVEDVRTAWGQFAFCWDPEGNPLDLYESAYIRPDADPERLPG